MAGNDRFYDKLDIVFPIGNYLCRALKLSLEHGLRSFPSHRHGNNSWELHYIMTGNAWITLKQEKHRITAGNFFVTGPDVEHSQIPDVTDPMVEYCVYFKVEERNQERRKIHTPSFLERFLSVPSFLCVDRQGIGEIMRRLFQELEQKQLGYMSQVTTLLTQLLIASARNLQNVPEPASFFQESNLTDRNLLIIEESFLYQYGTITLERLAGQLGLSPRQTERRLKQHYGKTFQQKRIEARMSAAAIRLKETGDSIADIAEQLGYSSPEHFTAAFRGFYGCSPRTYRKNGAYTKS